MTNVHPSTAKLFWSFLFLAVAVGSFISCAIAPSHNWWLPEDHSTFGKKTDDLFNMILIITTVAFVAVQAILCYFMWKYGEEGGAPRKGLFVHGHHTLEVAWTIVPAAILVVIAIVQWGTWLEIKRPANFPEKVKSQLEKDEPFVEILAGQFEWRITYPGKDGKIGTRDDVHVLNNFHIYQDTPILIRLRSRDVLHSLYFREFRLKQDAVPGMSIPVWFQAKPDTVPAGQDMKKFDLMCAELCGWGHYKMKGALTVHKDQASFEKWLDEAKKAEEATD